MTAALVFNHRQTVRLRRSTSATIRSNEEKLHKSHRSALSSFTTLPSWASSSSKGTPILKVLWDHQNNPSSCDNVRPSSHLDSDQSSALKRLQTLRKGPRARQSIIWETTWTDISRCAARTTATSKRDQSASQSPHETLIHSALVQFGLENVVDAQATSTTDLCADEESSDPCSSRFQPNPSRIPRLTPRLGLGV